MSWNTLRVPLPSSRLRKPSSESVWLPSIEAYRKEPMVSWHQKQRPQSLLLTITNAGKAILVPLTASLYVPGALADTDKVIVDIGTGFFVERVRLLLT